MSRLARDLGTVLKALVVGVVLAVTLAVLGLIEAVFASARVANNVAIEVFGR
jgi:hypothetical protein